MPDLRLPAVCDFSINNVCNAACDFGGFARDKTLIGPALYVDTGAYSRALPILYRRGIRYLTLQGGEPLVHFLEAESVGFIVTNLARPAERVVALCNQPGTAEQWIKEDKGAIKWTRLSCRTFTANAVCLRLHARASNLRNFMRKLAISKAAEPCPPTSLREKLIKIGARVVSHARYVTFQMVEVTVSRQTFVAILSLIARLRVPAAPA